MCRVAAGSRQRWFATTRPDPAHPPRNTNTGEGVVFCREHYGSTGEIPAVAARGAEWSAIVEQMQVRDGCARWDKTGVGT
jgi:hypothetical protein